MSRKKHIEIAEEFGEIFANSMFKDFKDNPDFRGLKFSWQTFPNLVAKLARVYLPSSVTWWDKKKQKVKDELEQTAYKTALKKTEKLVKKMLEDFNKEDHGFHD